MHSPDMIVHLNGELLALKDAGISPLDRGFIFGDGLYEGLRAISWENASGSRILGAALHARRLQSGLTSAGIPFDASRIESMSQALCVANNLRDAFVYWQITSGTPRPSDPPRHRAAPKGLSPTVFGYCSAHPPLASVKGPFEKRVTTCRDVRWELGQIKSTSLMGNVWAARRADASGCDEAILIRNGSLEGDHDPQSIVSEGLATNLMLVLDDPAQPGRVELVTPSLESAPMLAGVSRALLLSWVPEIRERVVRYAELALAREVLLIGTTMYVASVVEIDGRTIGNGHAGPVAQRLFRTLIEGYLRGRDLT